MKHLLSFLPVLLLLLTACEKETITPSGNLTQVSHPFYIDYFDVHVSDGIQYTITPSDTDKVVIETDDNVQSEVEVKVFANILYINKKKGNDVEWEHTTVRAHLYTTQTLSTIQGTNGSNGNSEMTLYGLGGNLKIILSGGSTFNSAIHLASGSLWVELSGGSTANVTGTTHELRLLSETGSILNAYELNSTNLILQIFSGASTAYATVSGKIFAADAKGGSKLYYKGLGIVNENSSFSEGAEAIHVD